MSDHTQQICEVDGCATKIRCRGLCEKHYCRLRRTGKLELDRPWPRPQRGICTIEGCGKPDHGSHGLCSMHHTRVCRHGAANVVIAVEDRRLGKLNEHSCWKAENVGYNGAHMRVRAVHGSASQYDCADCGGHAKHWSYNHTDPNEQNDPARGPYGLSAEHYSPRCVSCHKVFDLGRTKS